MGDEQGAVRSRTFTWHDPDETMRAGRTMSGLDLLRAIVAGELPPPPIAALMGFQLSEAEEGHVVSTMEPAEYPFHRFILSSHVLISRHLWSASFLTGSPVGAILLSGWRRQDVLGSTTPCTWTTETVGGVLRAQCSL
jgi:hypothetical protein